MKNILLATTALVFTAGAAAAEVTLSASGYGNFGFKNAETATAGDDETVSHSEIGLSFSGSATTDTGITVAYSQAIVNTDGAGLADDDATVSISGSFGKLSFGAVGEADAINGLADLGFDGIGMDDAAETYDGKVAHDVNYTGTFGAVTVSASAAMATAGTTATPNSSTAFGVKYSMGSTTVGVGFADHDITSGVVTAADGTVVNYGVTTTLSGLTIDALYSEFDTEVAGTSNASSWGVNFSYPVNESLTLVAAVSDMSTTGYDQDTGIGFAYDMGAGMTLSGAAGTENNISQADLGVSFAF
jgi:outer membrane protein OmpU